MLFNFGQSRTNIALPGGDADSGMAFHSYPVDVSREPDVLANAQAWSGGTGGALLESEFGATQNQTDIDRQVDENDGALIPWIWWSYDGELVPDLTVAPGGANLSVPVADALIRPHPVLVAGTPTSLAYDESTETMTFTQSTTAPDGSRLASARPPWSRCPTGPIPRGGTRWSRAGPSPRPPT